MKKNLLILLCLFALFSTKADAQFKDYVMKGGIQYNQLMPFSEYKASLSFLGRAYLGFELTNLVSIEIGGGYGQYKTTDDFHPSVGSADEQYVKTEIIPFDARLRLSPWSRTAKNWNPYFYTGAGLTRFKVKDLPSGIIIPEYAFIADGWTAHIPFGFGTEIKMGNNVLLDLSANATYTFTDMLNSFALKPYKDAYGSLALGLTFTGSNSGMLDNDKDGLINMREEEIGTDPENPDTDGDGLKDGAEVDQYKTNPLAKDTDGEGLGDGEEVLQYSTNPLNRDSDNDKLNDYEEVKTYMTLPNDRDTEDDGLIDGDEVLTYKTNPRMIDTDLGTIGDGIEVGRGTNPLNPDDDLPIEAPREEAIKVGAEIVLEGINFASGSYEISPGSEDVLDKAYLSMRDNPAIDVEISGHTDSRGGREMNMNLSKNRAESVKSYLVAKGIDGTRIETNGYGPDQPIATNDTDEGRLKNRRIVFKRVR
ncbi:MAG: OmpA family protein [bacterium]|nr:OmpA family protein [bacterium]